MRRLTFLKIVSNALVRPVLLSVHRVSVPAFLIEDINTDYKYNCYLHSVILIHSVSVIHCHCVLRVSFREEGKGAAEQNTRNYDSVN